MKPQHTIMALMAMGVFADNNIFGNTNRQYNETPFMKECKWCGEKFNHNGKFCCKEHFELWKNRNN